MARRVSSLAARPISRAGAASTPDTGISSVIWSKGKLAELDEPPAEDSAMLRKVSQSRKYTVWRLSHRYEEGLAVRTIAWFDGDVAVIALFSNNKAQMGDVFYNAVGTRADQIIEQYLRELEEER